MLCGAPSCSEACLFFSDDLLRLWLQSVQCDLQHDFARVTDEAGRLQQAHHHPPEGSPFHHNNTTSVTPTSKYDDNDIEEFYDQLQNVIDQTPKKDIVGVQGDWNAKVGRVACGNC